MTEPFSPFHLAAFESVSCLKKLHRRPQQKVVIIKGANEHTQGCPGNQGVNITHPLPQGRGVLKHSHSENTKSPLIQGILSITLFETSHKSLYLEFCLEKAQ